MPHFVRQQDQHQRGSEGQSQQQARRLCQCPIHGKDRQHVIVEGKSRQIILKIELHVRTDYQRSEEGRQKQQDVQPVTPFLGTRYVHFRRTVILNGRRQWGNGIRHEDSGIGVNQPSRQRSAGELRGQRAKSSARLSQSTATPFQA